MNLKKTLLGIVGIPLALTLAYSSANYVDSRIQGRDAPLIVAPNLAEMDPVILAGAVAGVYSAYKNSKRRENDNCRQ